ncbi:prolipoprotein diacylglyceryl transferase [Patescibacteria group bacterium]|nr:prolipoprotein diacylglyceryl transferase [Patescibacteria group bacterium]
MISPYIQVGSISIYYYSLFILLGIVLGFLLARPEAKRFKISGEVLFISIFYALIPGFIGARLYHVIDQWSVYSQDPSAILATWNGGLGILGALAGGALGLWTFYRLRQGSGGLGKNVSFLRLLDVWAPSVLLGQTIGRFGNWTNQEAFGQPTDAPWGIFISPENRPAQYIDSTHFHPTFFYEAGFDFAGLAILLLLRPKLRSKPGAVLGAYLVIYGLGRFLVEFFRFDTAHLAGIAIAHVIAVALVILGVYLLTRKSKP